VPGVVLFGVAVPGVACGVGVGLLHGAEVAEAPVPQGGCVPAVLPLLLEPLPPGVAVVPGLVSLPGAPVWVPGVLVVPGVLLSTVPGAVGGGVVGVAVEGDACPGVVVCGEVLIPVLPVAPGPLFPGCGTDPAPPDVCGAKAAAISTGLLLSSEELVLPGCCASAQAPASTRTESNVALTFIEPSEGVAFFSL
jgi:hypothetical protein